MDLFQDENDLKQRDCTSQKQDIFVLWLRDCRGRAGKYMGRKTEGVEGKKQTVVRIGGIYKQS